MKKINKQNIAETGCLVNSSNPSNLDSVKAAAKKTYENAKKIAPRQSNLADVVQEVFKLSTKNFLNT